ncbi:hypothetical protein Tco_0478124 [Tanacetum coccineum]
MFRTSGVQIPENNLDKLSLTREEDDGISVALDPQIISGFDVSTSGGILNGHNFSGSDPSFDPQLLVEHFNPVEDITSVLESDMLDHSTCLMLLEDMRGSENLTFLILFIGVTSTNFSLSFGEQGDVLET